LVKEAIEIHLNNNNFNRDGVFILSQAWSPITNILMKVKAGPSRAGTRLCPPILLSLPVITGRYIMTWTDFRGSQFPDDDDGYGR
jgi:hypothetical protein